MTLKFPRFETTAFHPPPWLKPIIPRDTRLSDLFYFHFTRIYIYIFFLFPSSRYLTVIPGFFIDENGWKSRWKEKRGNECGEEGKGKKERIDLRFKLLEEFFSKLYPKQILCAAAATLSWIIIIAVKGANETSITYTR